MENLFKSAEKVYKKSITFKGYHKFNYYNCFITIFGFKFLATLEAFLLLLQNLLILHINFLKIYQFNKYCKDTATIATNWPCVNVTLVFQVGCNCKHVFIPTSKLSC